MKTFAALDYALISPRHLAAFLSTHSSDSFTRHGRVSGDDGDDDPDDDEEDGKPWWQVFDAWGDRLAAPSMSGDTAIIPVKGVITSGLPTIYRAFGSADTGQISGWVRAAAADPDVKKIILDIDSPGGMVTGTPELGMDVAAACLQKSVIAHTKGMMDSAAYWVGSQCDELYCTPSADVGCIGVYQMNYDWTGWLKQMGIKAEMFKSGDLKGTGSPYVPLSAEQRDHIQAEVDTIGVQFRAAVKSKRTLVEDDSMRGQSFIGTEAAARNLVAGLRTLDSLLG